MPNSVFCLEFSQQKLLISWRNTRTVPTYINVTQTLEFNYDKMKLILCWTNIVNIPTNLELRNIPAIYLFSEIISHKLASVRIQKTSEQL